MKAHNSVLLSIPGANWIWLTLLACVWLALPGHGQIIVNEILADNKTNAPLPDLPDYFPDYVELYNTSDAEVDLGTEGWRIGDSGTNIAFTAGIKIPAHGFLLVFCDSDTNSGGFHTGFGLSGTQGDAVALYHNGLMVETNYFGIQAPDFALGRVPDAGNEAMVLTIPTPGTNNVAATLGDPLKLRINEWQSLGNIVGGSGRTTNDWIEIFNTDTNPVVLTGLVLTDDPASDLPDPDADKKLKDFSYIAPQGFAVIFLPLNANDADELDYFSISSSGGDQIWLYAADRQAEIDHVVAAVNPVPERTEGRLPDGAAFPNTNNIAFKLANPSRGESNFGQIPEIVINEALAHVDPPIEDAIELYNPTTTNVNVGYWWLSNNRNEPKKYQIPAGTVIPAGGFKVFYEYEFNNPATAIEPFNLNSAHGGEVYLFKAHANGDLQGFRRGIDFGASENGVSFGRWVTVATKIVNTVPTLETNTDIVPMATLSFGSRITRNDADTPANSAAFRAGTGAVNPYPKVGPVVISEIHYHPPDFVNGETIVDNAVDEFIELYNFSSQAVPLFDPLTYIHDGDFYADGKTNTWRLRGEVDFEFPTNVTLAANSRLLVVRFDPSDASTVNNFTNLFAIPGYPTTVQIFGPYRGRLSNGGATVTLYKPDPPQGPPLHNDERGFVPYIYADSIKYNDKSPWSLTADGMGFSLQRLVAVDFGNDPNNWKGDLPSPGRPNTPNPNPVTPPVITTHPDSAAGPIGGELNLSVAATGDELSYRWQFNGIQINGATTAALHLSNLSTNQSGIYRAIVINPAGVVYSTEAAITVVPSISDSVPPTVAITFPVNNARILKETITASGTARDNLAVAYVEVKLNGGEFARASGGATWSKELTLVPGVNTITARAVDIATNISTVVTRTITYTASASIDLSVNGQGTVSGINLSAPLVVGKTYKLAPKPARYWVFADWTGDVPSTSPILTFTMVDGMEIVANFVPNPFLPTFGTYNGLFKEYTGIRPESAGYFSFKMTMNGTFTALLSLAGKRYPTRGKLDLGGRCTTTIERLGSTPLTVFWQVNMNGSDTISGTVSNAAWVSLLEGDRLTAQQFLNPCPYAGSYTFVVPGDPASPTSPGGDSYGTILIARSGGVTISGALSDGSKFAEKTTISKFGDIPLYFAPNVGQGIFTGWLNLAPHPTTNFTAEVTWVKPVGGVLYPGGFSHDATLVGSKYVVRPSILNFTDGLFTLTGGNLSTPLSNSFTLAPGGRITSNGPDKLSLKFVPGTGLFSGTVTPTNTTTVIKFTGVVRQSATNGAGYFLGTNNSGRVTIGPAAP